MKQVVSHVSLERAEPIPIPPRMSKTSISQRIWTRIMDKDQLPSQRENTLTLALPPPHLPPLPLPFEIVQAIGVQRGNKGVQFLLTLGSSYEENAF
jgi:hypothetical protein